VWSPPTKHFVQLVNIPRFAIKAALTIIGATNAKPRGFFVCHEGMQETELTKLQAQKERWVTRIFYLGLEIAAIFAIPAALGAWIGTRLGGGDLRSGILVGTFILSWGIVIWRYRQTVKKMQALDIAIKAAKEKESIASPDAQNEN
jgi:hypothetical protein